MDPPATVAVLTYHSISAHTTPAFAALTVDPSLFAEQMEALRERSLDVIPVGEVPGALAAGRSAVAISIDDGLADAAENACPILARLGLTATLFVPTVFVGDHSGWLPGEDALRPMLSWATIDSLAQEGFEIASHGRQHIAADLNATELVERDARASRLELEDRIGRAVTSFAYPFGYHSASGRRAVRAAGYRQAFAVGDLPARADDDRWALPRLQVRNDTTPEALVAMVTRRPWPATRALARSKQGVWRLGRRYAGWGPAEAGRLRGARR
ncbi:MAG: polysaccharide deacetylase family protein [Solirubrobacteraceae bacterium]